ncbi:hypothetical protein, partial [Burkholderia cenocepacia]|uniref:hypothetical protein n=1 Tax=Burkholderia cenocepacia TaxID=95486 RepID=UPI001F45AB3A
VQLRRFVGNSAAKRIRNPFKQCPSHQSEALFNSLLGPRGPIPARIERMPGMKNEIATPAGAKGAARVMVPHQAAAAPPVSPRQP